MGRDEHHHRKNKKAKLPQTPDNQKGSNGVNMKMSKSPKVQFGVDEEDNR